MSRADEIAQGLREEGGRLTFPLIAEEYGEGFADYQAGNPPPPFTSASYDLGRNLGRRRAEEALDLRAVMDALSAEQERRHQAVRDVLTNRPDLLREYDVRIAAIRGGA